MTDVFYVEKAQSRALGAPGALDFTNDFTNDFFSKDPAKDFT